MVAEQGVVPADRVEGVGLPGRWPAARNRSRACWAWSSASLVAALPLAHMGEAVVGVGLPDPVAGLGGQVEGVPQLGVGVVEAAQPGVGAGEDAVGAGLRGRVAQPLGGGHRGPLGGGPVVPVPAPVEEGVEGPGQLPGVGVEPGGGGVLDGGEQHAVLGGEPGQRLLVVGEAAPGRRPAGARRG